MRPRNSNLRILSTAYAAGKLSKEQYRALRTKQLSALEFGKPLPPLPPGLSAVSIPDNMQSSTNLSARPPSSSKVKLPVIIVILLLLIGAFGGISYVLLQSAQEQEASELESMAATLQQQSDAESINRFASLFESKSQKEQAQLKQQDWAQSLRNSVAESISGIEAAKQISGGVSKEVEKKLSALKDLAVLLGDDASQPVATPKPSTTPKPEPRPAPEAAPTEAAIDQPATEPETATTPVPEAEIEAFETPSPTAVESENPVATAPPVEDETPITPNPTGTDPQENTLSTETPAATTTEELQPEAQSQNTAAETAPVSAEVDATQATPVPTESVTEEAPPPEFELIPSENLPKKTEVEVPAEETPAEEKPRESYKIETDPEKEALKSFFDSTPGY